MKILENHKLKILIILLFSPIFVTLLFLALWNLNKKIVYVIKINKVINYDNFDIDKLYNFLKNFKGDGLILYIDSPGGGLESYKIIEALKKLNVPKVCYIHYYGTSAAYWICSQTNYIIAEPFSIVGSIGGIMIIPQFEGLFKKLGIRFIVIKEGKYKDIGSFYRNISEEEKRILYKKLRLFVDLFRKDVLEKRDINNVSKVFSGEWFLGVEAKNLGLVDKIGDFDYAKEKIAKMLNTSVNRINFVYVSFEKRKSLLKELLGFLLESYLKTFI